jgi:hypothetical protein
MAATVRLLNDNFASVEVEDNDGDKVIFEVSRQGLFFHSQELVNGVIVGPEDLDVILSIMRDVMRGTAKVPT